MKPENRINGFWQAINITLIMGATALFYYESELNVVVKSVIIISTPFAYIPCLYLLLGYRSLKSNKNSLSERVEGLEDENENLKGQLMQAANDFQAYNKLGNPTEIQHKMGKIQLENKEFFETINQLREDRKQLRISNAQLSTESDQLKEKEGQLKIKLDQLEEKFVQLERSWKKSKAVEVQLKNEVEQLRISNTQLEAEKTQLDRRIGGKESSLSKMRAKNEELKKELEQLKGVEV